MTTRDQKLIVSRLPRAMFLAHSELLVSYLVERAGILQRKRLEVLEVGCGPRSPVVAILRRTLSNQEVRLHQIDARPDAVKAARQWNPSARVEQMFIHDMKSLETESKDLVIGMSVFDQNPTSSLERFASEIHRVLKPGGCAVYVHNEELNAPATTASHLMSADPSYLLPSTDWQPLSDNEYCLVNKRELELMLNSMTGSDRLRQYIQTMMPPKQKQSAKVTVPAIGKMTPETLNQVRKELATLESQGLKTDSVPTHRLLAQHVEDNLFCDSYGFELTVGDMFELQLRTQWQKWFREKPQVRHFVRGVARFGFASDEAMPTSSHNQTLNERAEIVASDDVLLTAYQYGLVARKKL